jgi:predicted S18 family serine protease
MKYILPLALVLSVATPAFAAEYYVVRGPDKKCKVVESRPTDKTMVVVGNKAFVTREEADKQVTVLCKE